MPLPIEEDDESTIGGDEDELDDDNDELDEEDDNNDSNSNDKNNGNNLNNDKILNNNDNSRDLTKLSQRDEKIFETSNRSKNDDIAFIGVISDMVTTGHSDGHQPDNLLMEIKGYKFAQNKVCYDMR